LWFTILRWPRAGVCAKRQVVLLLPPAWSFFDRFGLPFVIWLSSPDTINLGPLYSCFGSTFIASLPFESNQPYRHFQRFCSHIFRAITETSRHKFADSPELFFRNTSQFTNCSRVFAGLPMVRGGQSPFLL